MILNFGDYKGKDISSPEIPDHYICYLAKPRYQTAEEERVPFDVMAAARVEAERRGWTLKGETWEKDGQEKKINPLPEKTKSAHTEKQKCRNCGLEGKIIGDGLTSLCYWAVKGLTKGTPEYDAALEEAKKEALDSNYKPHKRRKRASSKQEESSSNVVEKQEIQVEAITSNEDVTQKDKLDVVTPAPDKIKAKSTTKKNQSTNPEHDPIVTSMILERISCLDRANKLGKAIDILMGRQI